MMIDFADLVKANAAKIKNQPEVAKLADAVKLIAGLKRQIG